MKTTQAAKLYTAEYEPISTEEDLSRPQRPLIQPAKRLFLWAIWVFSLVIALLVGFFAGRYSNTLPKTREGLLLPPGSVEEVWQHNLTFSQKPTIESEDAWSSIIPIGRGFVHHQEIAPFISNIAVFHQLHCLHGIRVAYYTTLHQLDRATGSTDPDEFLEQVGARTDNVHMRHCFDYLRHALMCAADTNLETVSLEDRKTTGWGSERMCRDYEAVKVWAEQWRNSSDTGIL